MMLKRCGAPHGRLSTHLAPVEFNGHAGLLPIRRSNFAAVVVRAGSGKKQYKDFDDGDAGAYDFQSDPSLADPSFGGGYVSWSGAQPAQRGSYPDSNPAPPPATPQYTDYGRNGAYVGNDNFYDDFSFMPPAQPAQTVPRQRPPTQKPLDDELFGGYENAPRAQPGYGSQPGYGGYSAPGAYRSPLPSYGGGFRDYGDALQDAYDYDDWDDGPALPPVEENRTVNGKTLLCNLDIKNVKQVRLQGAEKEVLGVMDFNRALAMAEENAVDLVLVNESQTPPICRLIAWSRYKYEVEKGDKDKKKKAVATVQELKEIRLGPKTDDGDVSVKVKQAIKFLEKGSKLKITMKFEGRELQFKEQGKELLLKFLEDLSSAGKPEGSVNFKSGTYTVILAPTSIPKPPPQQQQQAAPRPAPPAQGANAVPPGPPGASPQAPPGYVPRPLAYPPRAPGAQAPGYAPQPQMGGQPGPGYGYARQQNWGNQAFSPSGYAPQPQLPPPPPAFIPMPLQQVGGYAAGAGPRPGAAPMQGQTSSGSSPAMMRPGSAPSAVPGPRPAPSPPPAAPSMPVSAAPAGRPGGVQTPTSLPPGPPPARLSVPVSGPASQPTVAGSSPRPAVAASAPSGAPRPAGVAPTAVGAPSPSAPAPSGPAKPGTPQPPAAGAKAAVVPPPAAPKGPAAPRPAAQPTPLKQVLPPPGTPKQPAPQPAAAAAKTPAAAAAAAKNPVATAATAKTPAAPAATTPPAPAAKTPAAAAAKTPPAAAAKTPAAAAAKTPAAAAAKAPAAAAAKPPPAAVAKTPAAGVARGNGSNKGNNTAVGGAAGNVLPSAGVVARK